MIILNVFNYKSMEQPELISRFTEEQLQIYIKKTAIFEFIEIDLTNNVTEVRNILFLKVFHLERLLIVSGKPILFQNSFFS